MIEVSSGGHPALPQGAVQPTAVLIMWRKVSLSNWDCRSWRGRSFLEDESAAPAIRRHSSRR